MPLFHRCDACALSNVWAGWRHPDGDDGAPDLTQWAFDKAQGVSRGRFIDQSSASPLFIRYRYLVGSAACIVSNALILLTANIGDALRRIKRGGLGRID